MRLPPELLATARRLLFETAGHAPSQADLRRSVSTIYYALFHAIAEEAADLIAGFGSDRQIRSHAYRSVDHATIRKGCLNRALIEQMPQAISAFADLTARMQVRRHSADYDPDISFFPDTVGRDLIEAEAVLHAYAQVPEMERRRFLVLMLLRSRSP